MLAESSVNKDAMGIMEKKVLFVLAFAMLFIGMTVSSCSSDEDAPDNSIPRPNYPIYGDYIRDAKGEAATVYYENWLSNWALLDSDGNRYYFNLSSDSVDHAHFESLVKNGVLADDAHVKFDGKVYIVPVINGKKRWGIEFQTRKRHLYSWSLTPLQK